MVMLSSNCHFAELRMMSPLCVDGIEGILKSSNLTGILEYFDDGVAQFK